MNESFTIMPPSTEMPFTFLLLPLELRVEIYTYAALSSSFTFLRTCRQLNEEGTLLLYKHGIYRMRTLNVRREHLHTFSQRPPIHLIQNIYIAMPSLPYRTDECSSDEIELNAISLLEQFRGTEIRRSVCHFDLQRWFLTVDMANGLGALVGFEVVRVQILVVLYACEDQEFRNAKRDHYVRLIDEGLGSALGKAKWETKESVVSGVSHGRVTDVLVAEFRPWRSTS